MAEYIDKNRLILCMNDWMLQNAPVKAGDDPIRADTILDAIKMVEDSPAADVRENVRGRWIDGYQGSAHIKRFVRCSICGEASEVYKNFCPNCGAQMDVPDTDVGKFDKDTNVPSKSVANPNRLTNADRIRSLSDEELALLAF